LIRTANSGHLIKRVKYQPVDAAIGFSVKALPATSLTLRNQSYFSHLGQPSISKRGSGSALAINFRRL
jgi:hypothetical protein